MKASSYSRLWGYEGNRASSTFTPFQTDEEAKSFRDALYYAMKRKGLKVRRSTLSGQIRKYWSYGVECGQSCNVYELYYEDQ